MLKTTRITESPRDWVVTRRWMAAMLTIGACIYIYGIARWAIWIKWG